MFEQMLAVEMESGHRGWSLLASLAGQTVAIGVAVLLPLIFPEALPRVRLAEFFTEPPPPPPPSVQIVATVIERAIRQTQVVAGQLIAPVRMPDKAAMIIDEAPPAPAASAGFGVPGGIGVPGGTGTSVLSRVLADAVAPPPPPVVQAAKEPAAPPPPARIKVGGVVQQAKIVSQPMPVYPPLARTARIQGVVQLQAVIGRDGRIRELRAVSGHPLLIPAALAAVRQWVYHPTLLNGEPVEVDAPIEVNFTLDGSR
ncbi:MAG: energy transducer TonB [Acidobacteria bacterium]|nr:energy transducer TonB [Acidobacteriota bacterium]